MPDTFLMLVPVGFGDDRPGVFGSRAWRTRLASLIWMAHITCC